MKKHFKSILLFGAAAIILGTASIIVLKADTKEMIGSDIKASRTAEIGPKDTASNNQPSPDFKPGTKFAPHGLTVADNTFVCDSRRVDINGDGAADDVVLSGEIQGSDNPYAQNIGVAIKDGHTGRFSVPSVGEFNGGLDPKLFIGSFIKAKSHDILVSLATGGSGGVYQYALLTYKDGHVMSIVPQKELNQGLALETHCLPGVKLKIMDKNTGYQTTIDLHKGLDVYVALGIYNEKEELLKDPMVLIDGFSVLKPELNGDGIYELHGIQRISVAAHANSVADAESVWTVSNGQLKLLSENIRALN